MDDSLASRIAPMGEQEYLLARRAAANPQWDAKMRARSAAFEEQAHRDQMVRQGILAKIAAAAGRAYPMPAASDKPSLATMINSRPVPNPSATQYVVPPHYIGVRG